MTKPEISEFSNGVKVTAAKPATVDINGVIFTAINSRPLPGKKGQEVLYQAPAKGPRFWVKHLNIKKGTLPEAKQKKDISLVFGRILGRQVIYDADGDYYMLKDSNQQVVYDRQVARFVAKQPDTKKALKTEKSD